MDTIVTDLTVLRQKSEKIVDLEGLEIVDLFERLEAVRKEKAAFGVAAIQIGIPKRAIVLMGRKGLVKMVNPEIIEQLNPVVIPGEQCLSIPGSYKTIRYLECQVKWTDPDTKIEKMLCLMELRP